MPVGLLLTQQMISEIKNLKVMKSEPQEGEWETHEAVTSQGNFASFSQDVATSERSLVQFGEGQAS